MAKSPPRTRFLLIRTSKHTGIFFMRKEGEELCPGGTQLSKALAPFFSETRVRDQGSHPGCRAFMFLHTVLEAFATGCSFWRRFSRKAANMALARAGNRRCIRSMR